MNSRERRQNYRLHRLRVQKATSLVNSQAPKPKQSSEQQRDISYLEMMQRIFLRDNQRTFTQSPVKFLSSEDINFKNNFSPKEFKNSSKKRKPFIDNSDFISAKVFQHYEQLNFVKSEQLLQQLLRPCIFLDVEIDSLLPVGRLVIQLFTEACPEVVLQFVRCCMFKENKRFNISRLLCPLWLEAEFVLDDTYAESSSCIEHDPMAINHDKSSGILSFPSRYLRGSKFRFFTFTISFTPINNLNGKRIAFGIIRHGHNVLEYLQGLKVTRCGKPAKNVNVTACGVLYC